MSPLLLKDPRWNLWGEVVPPCCRYILAGPTPPHYKKHSQPQNDSLQKPGLRYKKVTHRSNGFKDHHQTTFQNWRVFLYRPTLLPNAFFSLKSWGMSPVPQVVCVAYLDIGFLNWEGPDPDATKTILFFIGKPNCHETILFRSCHFHPPGLAVLEIELFQTIRQSARQLTAICVEQTSKWCFIIPIPSIPGI